MRTYNDLIKLVRNWSNRDEEVLDNKIIANCISYAADKAYRNLRVPPLEQSVKYNKTNLEAATYDANNGTTSITELLIPSDLIEFISIRGLDNEGRTTRVFNAKEDIRTFYDTFANKNNALAFWTRKGNNILISPGFNKGVMGTDEDSIELYYYKRLYDLDARYDVTAANANLAESFINSGTPVVNLATGESAPTKSLKKAVYTLAIDNSVLNTVYYETTVLDSDIPAAGVGEIRTITTDSYYGSEVPNWLRDENERILLNGALAEAFIYLNEPESASMYANLFGQEINELNQEEHKRANSGGNIQVSFSSHLI